MKIDGKWQCEEPATFGPGAVRKTPDTCGPIDHAFMTPFVFVRPTGQPLNVAVGKWAQSEMEHAIKFWRAVFRGDVQVISDEEALARTKAPRNVNDESHGPSFILWGDISSNKYLAAIADALPMKWDANNLDLGGHKVSAAHHVPILIHPNIRNHNRKASFRYVVINSGHTFREFALLNNSDQTPKLPDWAIVDITKPADSKWPGLIYDAGFFDENWK
jgi:hypothetical protein